MHDFYVSLKFNKFNTTVKSLYRLFVAGCMLQKLKLPGSTREGHNYSKKQLMHLLVLQYWNKTGTYAGDMMKHNTGIFNEELGETTFSMLARCTLGDTILNEFEHMNKMYCLLPVLREIKDEVFEDSGLTNSLSWRHTIKVDGDEVSTSTLFFKSMIKRIKRGTHKVYAQDTFCYRNYEGAFRRQEISTLPNVYMNREDLRACVLSLYTKIDYDIHTYFLYRYSNVWPEAKTNVSVEGKDYLPTDDDSSVNNSSDDEVTRRRLDYGDVATPTQEREHKISNKSSDDEDTDGTPLQYFNSSNHWGNINNENVLSVPRQRHTPVLYLPSKRRINGKS